MELHHATGFCHWCCQARGTLWRDECGSLICCDCRAALIRETDRVAARQKFSAIVTFACFALFLFILFWCWLADCMGWR